MTSQITSLTIVYSTVYSGTDQRKHQSSATLAFVRGINRWPVNSPHKWPVTRKRFPFDDVIMWYIILQANVLRGILMKTRWRHDMETHKAWLPLCEEIHHSPMVSSHAGSSMLWCFLFCLFKQVVKQTIELPVIWDAMILIWRHCNVHDLCKTLVLYFQVVWSNVQQLVKHKTFRLLIPLMIFNGFEQGFVYADFNKVTAKWRYITETEMFSFWRNFHHWLHFNNIQCDQWWKFHQNDIFVSV